MLPSVGLFKSIPCPLYPHCERPTCFYSHTVQRSSTIQDRPASSVKRQKTTPASTPSEPSRKPLPRQQQQQTKPVIDVANKVTPLIPAKPATRSPIPPARSTTSSPASSSSSGSTGLTPPIKRAAISARAAAAALLSTQLVPQSSNSISSGSNTNKRTAHTPTFKAKPTGPPTILPNVRSNIPLKVRQLIATKLFDQFKRIYEPILSNNPTLATDQTKLQEEKILAATTNEAGYKQMAMTTIMNLKKRPLTTGDTDIGLDGEWQDPATVKKTAKILYEKALECLVPIDTLRKLEYPLPDLLSLPQEKYSDMVGTIHVCDRCKKEYLIKDILDKNDMDSCIYHPARIKIMKVDGLKEKVYGCCEDVLGSVGCTRGPHVYKDTDLTILHKKTPFLPTPPQNPKSTTAQNLVALDCEMGYTTAGMELIRLTAVDQEMNVLLDEKVLPSNMIIDLNTHYSGIKTLEGVKYDLVGLRKELFKYVDEDTIIVGHGLENDMNALRIIHTKIIDTVALYPHSAGLPYRNSLKGLSSSVLKKFIQTGTEGHDSFEDARVCIELLEAYIKRQDKLKKNKQQQQQAGLFNLT